MADIFNEAPINEDDDSITLDTLVGDGRKYTDPDQLAKAYIHADTHIAELKARLVEAETANKIKDDILNAQLKNRQPRPEDERREDANLNHRDPPPNSEQNEKSLDLAELVRKEFTKKNDEDRRVENINKAAEALNKHYGSAAKAQEAIRNRANELNVSFEWLRDVASTSPGAFLASMGVDPNARSTNTPSVNSEVNLRSTANGTRNFRYYEDLRKSMPALKFYSRDIQDQMFRDVRDLGEKFYV